MSREKCEYCGKFKPEAVRIKREKYLKLSNEEYESKLKGKKIIVVDEDGKVIMTSGATHICRKRMEAVFGTPSDDWKEYLE